nr:receptor type tyrosine protein phosphatase [Hymenolepis microstoma]
MNIVELCGETPLKVTDSLNFEDLPFNEDNSILLSDNNAGKVEQFSPTIKALNIDWNFSQNAKNKEHEVNFTGLNQDEIGKPWYPNQESQSLVQYFKSLFGDANIDAITPPQHQTNLRVSGKATQEKRFSRDKGVKFKPGAELDHQVWMRFSKPVNYIDADRILRELSEIMGIRPPIARFQLDKTGRVLLFFVPFESGMLGKDIVSMMPETLKWINKNSILQYGVGFPFSKERKPDRSEPVLVGTGRLSKIGFVAVVVVCALAVLVALLLFVHILIKRREKLSGYIPAVDKTSRKPSERPLVGTASPSPSGSILNISVMSSGNDSLGKQAHQESTLSCSAGSPPLYQETTEHCGNQGTYRPPLVSTGGSEAFSESMAAYSNKRTTQLNSNSSWRDEPVQMTLDVTTGHLILSYMEEHLKNRYRLDADWEEINAYESDEAVPCEAAGRLENACKNRAGCPIPYEQTRVMLMCRSNGYINASLMYDHDPRNPSYIAAETPLLSTVGDFWQMVWEQFAVVIICLEPESALTQVIEDPFNITGQDENDTISQARYWPPEGCMVFGNFEVRLVSEHKQCSDYITRSFYLKDRDSDETRTVTQFHFLSWAEDTPSCEVKTMLEFRRKVNKSFRAKNSPIIVHCKDGSSKTGTYLLLDLVLNRISKGVKELDVAASLEHLRDQRQGMIKTKGQFELVLAAIAEEVNVMLSSVAASAPTSATAP